MLIPICLRSYYGLPSEEKMLPFQSGLGQTLLVWYHDQENYPNEFYQNRFLWEITDQGYQEVGDRGFGYFRDKDLLRQAIAQYNLVPESLVAFSWNSQTEELKDVTVLVREELFK
jgi:hypothetical protein